MKRGLEILIVGIGVALMAGAAVAKQEVPPGSQYLGWNLVTPGGVMDYGVYWGDGTMNFAASMVTSNQIDNVSLLMVVDPKEPTGKIYITFDGQVKPATEVDRRARSITFDQKKVGWDLYLVNDDVLYVVGWTPDGEPVWGDRKSWSAGALTLYNTTPQWVWADYNVIPNAQPGEPDWFSCSANLGFAFSSEAEAAAFRRSDYVPAYSLTFGEDPPSSTKHGANVVPEPITLIGLGIATLLGAVRARKAFR